MNTILSRGQILPQYFLMWLLFRAGVNNKVRMFEEMTNATALKSSNNKKEPYLAFRATSGPVSLDLRVSCISPI